MLGPLTMEADAIQNAYLVLPLGVADLPARNTSLRVPRTSVRARLAATARSWGRVGLTLGHSLGRGSGQGDEGSKSELSDLHFG